MRYTVGFKDVGAGDVALAGGKGANLGELTRIPGIDVPPGFIVTTDAYRAFLRSDNQLAAYIAEELRGLTAGAADLSTVGKRIREAIRRPETRVPSAIAEAVREQYRRLAADAGTADLPVAVRSSASAEDLPDASFAGQQDTYLNIRGEDAVLDAVRRCWASLFTDRAISYRMEKGFDHLQVEIAVVVQRMIKSAKSGTAFTVDIETGWSARHGTTRGVVYLDVGEGLGEAIVSGRQTPDRFLLAVSPSGEMVILEKRLGAKEVMLVFDEEKGGTRALPVPADRRRRFSIPDEKAIEIGRAVLSVAEYYGDMRDVEFALDERGKLWLTQARPETVYAADEPNRIKQKKKAVRPEKMKQAELLCTGTPGSGAASGRAVVIDARDSKGLAVEMRRVRKGDILCTEFTTPDMVPVMRVAAGFVTAVGGSTSHAAIVARELRKPAVVGVGAGALDRLRRLVQEAEERGEDLNVTVDADAGRVYTHRVPLPEVLVETGETVDIDRLPVTRTKIGLIVANPFVARRFPIARYTSHYGVSLLRAEFVLAQMGIHPQALLAYDRGEFEPGGRFEKRSRLKKRIAESISGHESGRRFYVETLGRAIASIAATQTPEQTVIYRTTDFKSNEYREMWGGYLFEQEEANPMLGFRGEGRMIDPAYAEVFRWELEAIKFARSMGYRNVAVMLPVVRTPKELRRALDFLAAEGLRRGEDGLQIGMMAEVPYNALDLEAFLVDGQGKKRLDFISIGSNDLTQFMLATGRDNDRMRASFDETDPAVVKALETVIRTAKNLGVKTGLCGQRPSNDPAFAALLVKLGIDSIGVADTSYVRVVHSVAAAEAETEAKETAPKSRRPLLSPVSGPVPAVRELPCIRIRAAEIVGGIGQHPFRLKEAYPNAERLYQHWFFEALVNGCATRLPGMPVVFSTNDLDSAGFYRLEGGRAFETVDENPLMGFSGLARWTDQAYEPFFRWELRAVRSAIARGFPVRLELTHVRTLDELDRAFKIIAEEGLEQLPVGMEIATPGNLVLIESYLRRRLDFISINERRLIQYVLAADLQNPRTLVPPAETAETLGKIRKMILQAAAECGINVLAGERCRTGEELRPGTRLPYPYRIPAFCRRSLDRRPPVLAEIGIDGRESRLTCLEGELNERQRRILTGLLSDGIQSALRRLPSCRRGCFFKLVITPHLEWIAEADIDGRSVFIHPCFFSLSEADQRAVLYHELVSHAARGEKDEEKAQADTAAYLIRRGGSSSGEAERLRSSLVLALLNQVYRQIYGPNIEVTVDSVDVRELTPTHDLDYRLPDVRGKIRTIAEDRVPLVLVWNEGGKYILDGHGRAAVAHRLGLRYVQAVIIKPTGAVRNSPVGRLHSEMSAGLSRAHSVAELKVDLPFGPEDRAYFRPQTWRPTARSWMGSRMSAASRTRRALS